jgi:hypothetical protein
VNIETVNEENYVKTILTEKGDNDEEYAEEHKQLIPPQLSLEFEKDLNILSDHIAESNYKQNNNPHHQV